MKYALFSPTLLAAVALVGSTAFAATPGPTQLIKPTHDALKVVTMTKGSDRCTALQSRFDSSIKTHETAKKASAARALRSEGGQLCASGKTKAGIKKLEQALNDIGVKPYAKN